jgi:hypothetical protein
MKCIECKKEFIRSNSDIKRGRTKYCSMDCYMTGRVKKSKYRIDMISRTGKKQCQFCKKTKSTSSFFKNSTSKDGYGSYCKQCKIDMNRENYAKNRHKHIDQRKNSHLIKTYGITLQEYKRLLSKQEGVCAICKCRDKHTKLVVDHDHKTGEIRGLLCNSCNRAIGYFGDDVVRIKNSISYLKGWY